MNSLLIEDTPDLIKLKEEGNAPEWMTPNSLKSFKKRMLKNETPKDSFERVVKRFEEISGRKDYADLLRDFLWKGWIGLATPVHSNFGSKRGLPISCFKIHVEDNLTEESGILPSSSEIAEMSRVGGGVGISLDNIRPAGAYITGNGGKSGGVLSWMRIYDVICDVVAQATRRGSGSVSLDIEHKDWDDFIEARDNTGDPRRRVYDLHLSTRINGDFMSRVINGEPEARKKWQKLLQYRWETGESYIEFDDNVNKNLPLAYQDRGMKVKSTNICSEILQYTDKDHSVVCDLSSLNLAKYDEWKDQSELVIETLHRLLDAVMTDFLERSHNYAYLSKARNGATKARAIGIGVLGWHDLLFKRGLAFDNSMETMILNAEIFKKIKDVTTATNQKLAREYGEPEWLKGYGMRNMFTTAIAPTKSNSACLNVLGEGIAPCVSSLFEKEGAEGTVFVKNKYTENILSEYGKNDDKTWKSIARNKGSVQHLDFLSEKHKKMLLTAREIDQHKLIKQVAARQKFIDQGQSCNLWFPANASESYINSVHLTAYKLGVKTLYYVKSGAAINGDSLDVDCEGCEG